MAGKLWWPELETADHSASMVQRQMETDAGSSPLLSPFHPVQEAAPENGANLI